MINGFDIDGEMINGLGAPVLEPLPELTWTVAVDNRGLRIRYDARLTYVDPETKRLRIIRDNRNLLIPYDDRRLP